MTHSSELVGIAALLGIVVAGCGGDEAEDPAELEDVAEFPGEPQGPNEDEQRELPPPEDSTEDREREEPADDRRLTDEEAADVNLATTSGEPGEYLTGGGGVAVYGSTRDADGESHCTGDCLDDWPIVSTAGEVDVQLGDGVDDELVDTIEREDGTLQLTYGGYPLHRYIGDADGSSDGHGADGTWSLVHPDGELLLERSSE